jgi:hypothetical protein
MMRFSLKWLLSVPLLVGLLILVFSPHENNVYWIGALRVAFFILAVPVFVMIVQGGRWLRAFGLGALCPSVVGIVLAAHPFFHGPIPAFSWSGDTERPPGLMILARRGLEDGSQISDVQFDLGFLLSLGVVCGLVGVGVSWLTNSGRSEQDLS